MECWKEEEQVQLYKEIFLKNYILPTATTDDAVFWYNKEYKMITRLNLHIIIIKKDRDAGKKK